MNKDRKLTAIMFIDMVGYTAMMQEDEEKTQVAIQHQREIVLPIVESHNGKVLRYIGDGTLCTFESAKRAVNAAVEIQRTLLEDPIMLRIGIHIGDIVSEDGDIYGDGVNVASRLEPLAPPGGICLSETVYDNIKNQTGIKCVSIGKKYLKNVKRPMEVYALKGEGLSSPGIKQKYLQTAYSASSKVNLIIKIAAIGIVILFVWMTLRFFSEGEFVQKIVADENSIAVLFIENIADPEDSHKLTQMIKELLITDLSQSKTLRVIGSQRLYDLAKKMGGKDGSQVNRDNASKIAREARAQWMLNGSLAQLGEKMILITQIENVNDGKILDAQRADGTELFEIIDQISAEIREDLGIFTSKNESDFPVEEITTDSPEAYKLYIDGLAAFWDNKFAESALYLSQAVELDSTFSQALLYLTVAQVWIKNDSTYSDAKTTVNKLMRNSKGLDQTQIYLAEGAYAIIYSDAETAMAASNNLIQEFPDSKWGYYLRAEAFFFNRDFIKTLEPLEKVIYLDPEFKMAYIHLFEVYFFERLYDRGIDLANQYNQKFPNNSLGYYALGHFHSGKNENTLARSYYEKAIALDPDYLIGGFNYLDFLISENDINAAYGLLRKLEEGESYSRTLVRVWIKYYEELLHLWNDTNEEIPERREAMKRLAALKQES